MNMRAWAASLLLGVAVSGCGGGGSGVSPSITAAPVAPQTLSQTQAISQAAGTVIAAPNVAGYAPSVVTPHFSAPFSATVTTANVTPVGLSTFALIGPIAQSVREAQARVANATTLLYVALTPAATVTVSGTTTLNFELPTAPTTATSYYLPIFDGATWNTAISTTPGLQTATGVSFALTLPTAFTLTQGVTYAVALYAVPSNATPAPAQLLASATPGAILTSLPVSASPTSVPSSVATASPTAAPSAAATATASVSAAPSATPTVVNSLTPSPAPTSTDSTAPGPMATPTTGAAGPVQTLINSGATLANIVLLDGSTATVTLPALTGNPGAVGTAIAAVANLPAGTVLPAGTFLGAESVVPLIDGALPASSLYSYVLTVAPGSVGKTFTLYYLTSGAPQLLDSELAGGVTLTNTLNLQSSFMYSTSDAYILAVYQQ